MMRRSSHHSTQCKARSGCWKGPALTPMATGLSRAVVQGIKVGYQLHPYSGPLGNVKYLKKNVAGSLVYNWILHCVSQHFIRN